jgi:hypothetical protein
MNRHNYKESGMKKVALIAFYTWSFFMILRGLNQWVSTMGMVHGTEFGMQITIVGSLGAIMVWLALFGLWFSLPAKPDSITEEG